MRRSLLLLALFLGLGALAAPQQSASAADDKPVVVIDTTLGKITVELDAKSAPKTTENFLKYVDAKFYDGLVFHRVIPGFMIQGGGFDEKLRQKEEGVRAPIPNESGNGLKNERGTIAMARLPDPDSATCQFFINHDTTPRLDSARYAVFGKVIDGMDVVDKIAGVRTTTRRAADGLRLDDCPAELPVIKSIRRKDKS